MNLSNLYKKIKKFDPEWEVKGWTLHSGRYTNPDKRELKRIRKELKRLGGYNRKEFEKEFGVIE